MQDNRPVHLNLMVISMPVTAICSILHRISGVVLFILTPIALYMLCWSLQNESGFNEVSQMFELFYIKSLFLLFAFSLLFHLIAGVRHLLMDMGIGESLRWGRLGAWLVLVLSAVLIIYLGVVLW